MIPDLSSWRRAAAIVSFAVLALIGIGFAVGAPPSQAFYAFNMQRLREFQAEHDRRDAHTLRVVILGNSRMKNGTIDAAQIEHWAAQYGYARIEYFRLVANWAVFRDFAPLLDQVRALHPDVYVIQMDLLVHDMAPEFRTQLAFNYLRWLTAGHGTWSWYEPKEEQLDLICTDERDPVARAARSAEKVAVNPDSESPRMARAFIRKVAAGGTPVLLVTVPKSAALDRISPSINDKALASAREIAGELPSVIVAPFTDSLPDDHFCDVAHFNHRGATAFSRWLVGQIATVEVAELR